MKITILYVVYSWDDGDLNQGHLWLSIIFGCHYLGVVSGISGFMATVNHSTIFRTGPPPSTMNYLVQNASRAMLEKLMKSLSHVWLFVTPWTVALQTPLSMGFSSQEYWSGLPFPSSADLPDPGIKPRSSALQPDALPSEPPGQPWETYRLLFIYNWTFKINLQQSGFSWVLCVLLILHPPGSLYSLASWEEQELEKVPSLLPFLDCQNLKASLILMGSSQTVLDFTI